MSDHAIFAPLLTQMGTTFIIGALLLTVRIGAVRSRQISPKYFKTNRGENVPERMLQFSNHYDNQFAVPLLFYVLCIVAYVTNAVDDVLVLLAWGFVVSRLVHSFVHLTYNHVLHRLAAFFAGLLLVVVMWVKLIVHLVA